MADLVELLSRPDARAALARRDITVVYRLLTDAGVSQVQIAQVTGQRQSEVSAVLGGRRVQSVALLERIADGLGVPRGWMGLAYRTGREPEPVPDEYPGEAECRQNLLRHAATVLFGVPVFGVARRITVRDAPTPQRRRIGPRDVELIRSVTDWLEGLDNSLGGLHFSDALTAHASASEALLTAEMRDAVRRELLGALAGLHAAAGWAAADAGLLDRARQHFTRGMSCAAAVPDRERVSNQLRGAGRAELQFGDPNEALKLFQLGAATAPTALFRAVFENNAAWAFARLGLAEEARGALSRARHAFDIGAEDRGRWQLLAMGLSHSVGCAQIVLGSFDAAVIELTAAVDSADHAVRCSTINFSELATAQLRSGELRAGIETATVVIGKAKALRSVWVRHRLAPLQQAAAARRDSTCQDLARELATLRAAG